MEKDQPYKTQNDFKSVVFWEKNASKFIVVFLFE